MKTTSGEAHDHSTSASIKDRGPDAYFSGTEVGSTASSATHARFVRIDELDTVTMGPGVRTQPIVSDTMMLSFVSLDPYSEAPVHSHAEEQLVLVLEGEMEFELAGERRLMRPGDVALVPSWVPHGARTHASACREVDVFNPPREALLRLMTNNDEPE